MVLAAALVVARRGRVVALRLICFLSSSLFAFTLLYLYVLLVFFFLYFLITFPEPQTEVHRGEHGAR